MIGQTEIIFYGAKMKRFIQISLIMAGSFFLLTACSSDHEFEEKQADTQTTNKTILDEKEEYGSFPSRSMSGLFVSGWPIFCITYPANWQEMPPELGQVFRAQAPGESSTLSVSVLPKIGLHLDFSTNLITSAIRKTGNDVNIITDKDTKLRGGIAAKELEIKWIDNGTKMDSLFVMTSKEDTLIIASLSQINGTITEDLRGIPYSLRIKPGKEEAVELPEEIRDFLQQYSEDILGQDRNKIMRHYSDYFLNYGRDKKQLEDFLQRLTENLTSFEIKITQFEPQYDSAYLAGVIYSNLWHLPLSDAHIIQENGQWKWYGNQKPSNISLSGS